MSTTERAAWAGARGRESPGQGLLSRRNQGARSSCRSANSTNNQRKRRSIPGREWPPEQQLPPDANTASSHPRQLPTALGTVHRSGSNQPGMPSVRRARVVLNDATTRPGPPAAPARHSFFLQSRSARGTGCRTPAAAPGQHPLPTVSEIHRLSDHHGTPSQVGQPGEQPQTDGSVPTAAPRSKAARNKMVDECLA